MINHMNPVHRQSQLESATKLAHFMLITGQQWSQQFAWSIMNSIGTISQCKVHQEDGANLMDQKYDCEKGSNALNFAQNQAHANISIRWKVDADKV